MEDKQFASKKQINKYVEKCADDIMFKYQHYPHTNPIVLLGVLNGALPFLTDLSMRISGIPLMIDTVKCSSYTGIFTKSKVKVTKKPDLDLNNKTIIIVEDIVDSGDTINELIKFIYKNYKNTRVEVCALFKRETLSFRLQYVGRVVPQGVWLYGYGMDNDQLDRNLPRVMIKTVK